MDNDEIAARLQAVASELDAIEEEIAWREAGYPELADFDWSVRVRNVFKHEGITTLRELTKWSPEELLHVPNLGDLSVAEIQDKLAKVGLRLMDFEATRRRCNH